MLNYAYWFVMVTVAGNPTPQFYEAVSDEQSCHMQGYYLKQRYENNTFSCQVIKSAIPLEALRLVEARPVLVPVARLETRPSDVRRITRQTIKLETTTVKVEDAFFKPLVVAGTN